MSDAQRFEAIYRRAYPAVLAYCQRRAGDAARDVTADVFLVAWRRLDEVPDPALPWLLRTAGLTLRTAGRADTRQDRVAAKVAGVDPPGTEPDHADRVAQTDRVARALARLGDQDRLLLLLTIWDDLDPASAAAVVGCSRAAVRVRLHRARKRFAALLEPDSPTAAPDGLRSFPVAARVPATCPVLESP